MLMLVLLLGAFSLAAQKESPPKKESTSETPKEDKAIASVRSFLQQYVEAFNSQDLETISTMWAVNSVHVDHGSGIRTQGSKAIQADLAKVIKAWPESRLIGRADHIRFITPEVVSVSGRTTLFIPKESPNASSFSAILIKKEGGWKISSVDERPIQTPVTSTEALSDLEWLIGQWVDESNEARVDTTFKWTNSKAFLVRSYVVTDKEGVTTNGTQIIGWDPRSKQIRSWSFDSSGSFGDAVWSRNGNEWLIRSSRTMADGQAASGTYVLTKLNYDAITVQLIGHEIEGEPMPSSKPVKVVRVTQKSEKPADKKPTDDGTEKP